VTPAFLDTVGLLALWDASDQWHSLAESAFADLRRTQRPMLTTSFVLLECGNAAARRPYRLAVERLWASLDEAGLLVRPTEDEVTAAWAGYRRSDGDGAGIVDQVSFVVMRRLGLTEAFTNDRHFRAAGFRTLF
jgi:predicted nucleic acid-binding protein